jgi:hypothetical protein
MDEYLNIPTLKQDQVITGQGYTVLTIVDGVATFFLLTLCVLVHRHGFSAFYQLLLLSWASLQIIRTAMTILIVPRSVEIIGGFLGYVLVVGFLFESVRHVRKKGFMYWILNIGILSMFYFTPAHQDLFFLLTTIICSIGVGDVYLTITSFSVFISHLLIFYMNTHGDVPFLLFKMCMSLSTLIGASSLYKHFAATSPLAIPVSLPVSIPVESPEESIHGLEPDPEIYSNVEGRPLRGNWM